MRVLLLAILLVNGVAARAAVPWGVARGGGASVDLDTYDVTGAAALEDAALPPNVEEIVFTPTLTGIRSVGTLALSNRTLRISAEGGVVLHTAGKASVFRLVDGAWTLDGVSVTGSGLPDIAHYHGGAIDCQGGSLTVTNCSFAQLGVRFGGGAISARLMTDDVEIVDSRFTGNRCGTLNGTGGGIYASGRLDGPVVTLTVRKCLFTENRAQSGGAVTTIHTTVDEEAPVRILIDDTQFTRNVADYSGGAIYAQGEVVITHSTFTANTADVQGGAICLGGTEVGNTVCTITPQTEFRDNRVMNTTEWTCGGAIALFGEGNALNIDGRHVRFDGNEALSGVGGFGGAIFAASGTVSHVELAAFGDNVAGTAGGAFCVWGGSASLVTCISSNDSVRSDAGYGGAFAADGATLAITNNTIRYADHVAIDAHDSAVEIVNTLVADNGGANDVEVYGPNASLRMEYSAYGVIGVSDSVLDTLVTNNCLRGMTADVYQDGTLLPDISGYNPVASEGMPQPSYDHRGVNYGWQGGESFSIGAFEVPAPDEEPRVALESVTWFHNRADGRYYPRLAVRFLGGDASRLDRMAFTCNGVERELSSEALATLRGARVRDRIYIFGVDDAHWRPSITGDGFGYIVGWTNDVQKAELMLFAVEDPARSPVTLVGARTPVTLTATWRGPVTLSAAARRLSAAALPQTVTVPARFADFAVAGALAGRAETAAGATVTLYGCTALGAPWRRVGVVACDAAGRFTASVPEDLRFFRLEAEVLR